MKQSKPRIGETIRLSGGKKGTVQAVLSAKDVLQTMNEIDAMLFGIRKISIVGPDWLNRYFRVAVATSPGEVEWFECTDVEETED